VSAFHAQSLPAGDFACEPWQLRSDTGG